MERCTVPVFHYLKGYELYRAGEYAKAAEHFTTAYATYQSPRYLLNAAQSARKAGRHEDALNLFQVYHRQLPDGDPMIRKIDPVIAELEGILGPDTDGDEIRDKKDLCPTVPAGRFPDLNKLGCPTDRDADGVYDFEDQCPDIAQGPYFDPKRKGCPVKLAKVNILVRGRDVGTLPTGHNGSYRLVGLSYLDRWISRDINFGGNNIVTPDLPPGEYDVVVQVPNYLAGGLRLVIDDSTRDDEGPVILLAKQPKQSSVQLTRDEIVVKKTIHFETGTAKILPEGAAVLDEVADVLLKNPQIGMVSVEGHTDNSGDPLGNLHLSKDRAAVVAVYLIKCGVNPYRLTSGGFGSSRPIFHNITPASRAKNRRIEFRIVYVISDPDFVPDPGIVEQ